MTITKEERDDIRGGFPPEDAAHLARIRLLDALEAAEARAAKAEGACGAMVDLITKVRGLIADPMPHVDRARWTIDHTLATDVGAGWVSPEEYQRVVAGAGTQGPCASCLEEKPLPFRRDEMGGYVCNTCVDKRLDALRDEHQRVVAGAAAMREALDKARSCVGGDNPADGWDCPEDVWGICTDALDTDVGAKVLEELTTLRAERESLVSWANVQARQATTAMNKVDALRAENERLTAVVRWEEEVSRNRGDERDALRAENEKLNAERGVLDVDGLRVGVAQVRALLDDRSERDALRAENERLKRTTREPLADDEIGRLRAENERLKAEAPVGAEHRCRATRSVGALETDLALLRAACTKAKAALTKAERDIKRCQRNAGAMHVEGLRHTEAACRDAIAALEAASGSKGEVAT